MTSIDVSPRTLALSRAFALLADGMSDRLFHKTLFMHTMVVRADNTFSCGNCLTTIRFYQSAGNRHAEVRCQECCSQLRLMAIESQGRSVEEREVLADELTGRFPEFRFIGVCSWHGNWFLDQLNPALLAELQPEPA